MAEEKSQSEAGEEQVRHELIDTLTSKFGDRLLEARVQRERRLQVRIRGEDLLPVVEFLKGSGFDHLSCISGVDYEDRMEAVYHLWSYSRGELVQINAELPRDKPEIDSLVPLYRAADWHEREAYDMLGIVFRGHPNLKRMLLPEGFEGHPLRKDFKTKPMSWYLEGEAEMWETPVEIEQDGEGEIETMVLNIGPQHPSTHGVARLVTTLSGETVVKIEPIIGYLHRGVEKIAENRTYQQFLPLTDRTDYISSITNNLAYVLAVEELMGVRVPERAEYLRVILSELQRIANHLMFIAAFGADLGAWTVMMYGFREREMVLDLMEQVSGQRLLYNFLRIGGLKEDVPEGWTEAVRNFLRVLPERLSDYETYFFNNEIFIKRCEGVGVLEPELAIELGVTGPMLRASGVARDVRRDDPYSIYDRFDFEVVTEEAGDTLARFKVRFREIFESLRIIEQALDDLPEGEVRSPDVPKVIRPPKGEVYSRIEAPKGELAYYIVSDGKSTSPYRLKIRSPAFCNLSAFPHYATGEIIPDMIVNFASVDIVMGEIDR
ncbi:MAG: NADH-quinone oxidoreductase subunit D [Euryarchaeota archaeon]|nr:NADH-quinone oxidoreductase subunit D [Euryarchaeota archaeon]